MSPRIAGATFVVPIYNEATHLAGLIAPFCEWCGKHLDAFEVILSENGSRDDTVLVAQALCGRVPGLRLVHGGPPDYGEALKAGSRDAHFEHVYILELDCLDTDFVTRAGAALAAGAELVVGSKVMRGAADRRPLARRLFTRGYNLILKVMFGFRGSDTHGLKAYRHARADRLLQACRTTRSVMPTEFVLRCWREGLRVVEIPVALAELRTERASALKLLPSVARGFWQLRAALRERADAPETPGGPQPAP